MYIRVVLALWCLLGSLPHAAAGGSRDFARGEFIENVACQIDSTATYSLYLPSRYTTQKPQPALLIFDPRGRSLLAAELFRPAAEAYGWILLSSNDTRSDESWEPNAKALRALWPEVRNGRFAIDPQRIYAAGFSGGVIVAWYLAQLAEPPTLAGIVAAGGRPALEIPTDEIHFAHFGTAGVLDFNYASMKLLDRLVQQHDQPHQLRIHAGRHAWLPEALAFEAIEWFELLAMKNGKRRRDLKLVEALYHKGMREAERLEADRHLLAAWERYRLLFDTFDTLRSTHVLQRRLEALEANSVWARQRNAQLDGDAFENERLQVLSGILADVTEDATVPTSEELGDQLDVHGLQELARGESPAAMAAARILEWIYARTSFYMKRDLMAQQRYTEAASVLEVALEVHPEVSFTWYELGRVHALQGERAKALTALQRAFDRGFGNVQRLHQDPVWRTYREDERFRSLLEDNAR